MKKVLLNNRFFEKNEVIKKKYKINTINEALQEFKNNLVFNKEKYIKYDPEEFLPYPSLILKEMEKKSVYRLSFS